MSSSVYIYNKKKNILVRGVDQTRGLDVTTLSAVAQYSIKCSGSNKKFFLSVS